MLVPYHECLENVTYFVQNMACGFMKKDCAREPLETQNV